MTAQSSRILLVLSAFLGGLIVFSAAVFLVGGRGPVPMVAPSAVGGPFQLIDHNGKPVTEQDFKGKPFLVFFGFTHCPDVCPTTLFDVSQVFANLGRDAERVNALFVTVDPERDTPDALKEYLSSFDPHLRALTGDAKSIAAMEKAYRVYSKKIPLDGGGYTMDHTALVYLMDKEGRFVAPFNLKRRPEDSAADLRRHL